MRSLIRNRIYWVVLFCLLLLQISLPLSAQEGQEDTYSISLVQTAEADKEIVELEGKKILTETYKIKEGEHLWQIFRERGLLEKRNLPEILALLKTFNKSLSNLDLVHPGQEIVIPLTISPVGIELSRQAQKAPETPIPLEALKDLNLENYTVRQGDSLIKIVKDRYDVPRQTLYNEYLDLVKKLNPSVRDINHIYPNQKIRLPVYSPQVVRMPIQEKPSIPESPPGPEDVTVRKASSFLAQQLEIVFREMGEDWVNSGQHFIPLKAGGQAELNAESFPIINLTNGHRIIVDLYKGLPAKMAQVIVSNWENYQVVTLNPDEGLRGALDRILPLCGYPEIKERDQPIEIGGDISLRITADWIIQQKTTASEGSGQVIAITLLDGGMAQLPSSIKNYLQGRGIKAIEFPPAMGPEEEGSGQNLKPLSAVKTRGDLMANLLDLAGIRFSRDVEIPVYQGKETDFSLTVKADFLLSLAGKDCILDLSNLGTDILTLLKEHRFLVLTLSDEKDPSAFVLKTLEFLGVPFDSSPHSFLATDRTDTRNVLITLPGITFRDRNGQGLFATPLDLPDDIAAFLANKGYRILGLTFS